MPERRSYFAAAQIGGDVYVAGGMVGAAGTYVLRLERFDPRVDRWTREPDLPGEARAAGGAALGTKLYVVGGQTSKGVSRRTYAFDVKTRRWSLRAPLPAPRYNLAAATLHGTVYVAGGVRRIDPVRTVFAYDPGANRWRAVAPLPRPLQTFALVPFRGELWAIGGLGAAGDAVRSVWIYSPARQRWRAGPPACGTARDPRRRCGTRTRLRGVREVLRDVHPRSRLEARPVSLGASARARALRRSGSPMGDRRLRRARARRQPRRRDSAARLARSSP